MIQKKIGTIYIFLFFWAGLLISRLMVLTGNLIWSSKTYIILEVAYIIFSVVIFLFGFDGKIKIKEISFKKKYIQWTLLIYTLIFGTIFSNKVIGTYIIDLLKSQLMFLTIIIVTVAIVKKYKIFDKFIKVSFFSISIFMITMLVININQLDLSNIINVFNKDDRTRATFGFNHPNTLGNICVCNIMLFILIKKTTEKSMNNIIRNIFLVTSIVMLLSSASRSSISSLILYFLIYLYLCIDKWIGNRKNKVYLKTLILLICILLGVMIVNLFSIEQLLKESNRSLIFNTTLPTYFNSNRVLVGLGACSNSIYGNNLTPYTTYFIDNGYIYILVTTGIIGFIMIMSVLGNIINKILKKEESYIKKNMICMFGVYIYIALYEATLFSSSFFSNYIYLTLFMLYLELDEIKYKNKKENLI